MKSFFKSIFVIGLIAFFAIECNKRGSNSNQSSDSPPTNNAELPLETIDFEDVVSANKIDYALSGLGTSTTMELQIINKTERHWEVKLKVGTKLEPADGDVQNMVATKEVEIEVEPHDEKKVEIEVACLNISKEAPSDSNTNWNIEYSAPLAAFIAAANDKIDSEFSNDELDDKKRASILQSLLWKARGATKNEWVEFMVRYQGLAEDEARQKADALDPALEEMIKDLPDIPQE